MWRRAEGGPAEPPKAKAKARAKARAKAKKKSGAAPDLNPKHATPRAALAYALAATWPLCGETSRLTLTLTLTLTLARCHVGEPADV